MRPTLRFAFPRSGAEGAIPRLRSRVYKIIMAYGPNQMSKFLFAFSYHRGESSYNGEMGWVLADPLPDLARYGVMEGGMGNSAWRITRANQDYQLCDTYLLFIIIFPPSFASM